MRKYTSWFPGSVRPLREGLYQKKLERGTAYSYWDGFYWYAFTLDKATAIWYHERGLKSGDQLRRDWRGLSEPSM